MARSRLILQTCGVKRSAFPFGRTAAASISLMGGTQAPGNCDWSLFHATYGPWPRPSDELGTSCVIVLLPEAIVGFRFSVAPKKTSRHSGLRGSLREPASADGQYGHMMLERDSHDM